MGKNGAAISLANPVYLAVAGEATVRQVTANGVAGKLMPRSQNPREARLPISRSIAWSRASSSVEPSGRLGRLTCALCCNSKGDPTQGQKAFAEFCAHCHGADGKGAKNAPGSIVDPSYLALVSDQSLRSTIIAGRPDQGMPDWRSDISGPGSRAMTDQEITDIVAWLAAQRTGP
jgi:cytochrome c553